MITTEHLALTPVVPMVTQPAVERAPDSATPPPAPTGELQSVERAMIEQALRDSRFNKSKAAKQLGLTRTQLYVRLRRYGLE